MRIYFSTLRQNNVEILGTLRADRNTPIAQSDGEKSGVCQAGTVATVPSIVKSWYVV